MPEAVSVGDELGKTWNKMLVAYFIFFGHLTVHCEVSEKFSWCILECFTLNYLDILMGVLQRV